MPEGDRRAAELAAAAADRLGVEIYALTPYMTGLNNTVEVQRRDDIRQFRDCIDIASLIGARVIRVYAGSFKPGEGDRDRKWQLLVASLKELGDHAAAAGVRLCAENHFNTMALSARETAELVAAVDSPGVAALYDQANFTFTHQEDYPEAVRLQAGAIGHVHVKDLVFIDPEKAFVAQEVTNVASTERAVRSRAVGDGILDWKSILRALIATGYDGALSLEYEYRWHPEDLPPPEVGFARGAARLKEILAEVKRHERNGQTTARGR